MHPAIILDVDGVLIAFPDDESTVQTFTPQCVAAFWTILAAVPAAKVVFSTTWRLPAYVNRLHGQWLEHGFPLSLAIDGTPDLRGLPGVPRQHQRGCEIRAWLDANPDVSQWVVIDDNRSAIEEILDDDRCIFTDPARGLTMAEAGRAIRVLSM